MKKYNRFNLTMMATAACVLVLGSGGARAANVITQTGDLILGFRATGGQGSGFNLEVDLGSLSNYTNLAPGTVIDLSNRISLSDLQTTYSTGGTGNSWASRTDLFWSVAGTSSNVGAGGRPNMTLYGTSIDTSAGYGSGPVYNRLTAGTQTGASGNIDTLQGALSGSPQAGTIFSAKLDSTVGGSYTQQITANGNALVPYDNSSQSNWTFENFEHNTNLSSGAALADLYELQPVSRTASPGTDLGTFSLGSTGALTFTTPSAVPEPSTYAMFAAGVAGLLALRRLRLWQKV